MGLVFFQMIVYFVICCYYFQFHDITQPRITGQKCGTKAVLTLLSYFDALDDVPCPPQMKHEVKFQADLELEADEFESNNNVQNEPNENDSEPEKVHLMSLSEGIEAFDILKKLDEYLSIYAF